MRLKMILAVAALLFVLPLQLATAEDWPGWRGGDRTDISKETGLLKSWPEGGPKQLWVNKKAGVGYSSFAVVGDNLYTLGAYKDDVRLICLDAKSGEIRWRTVMEESVLSNGWGDGPRGTPIVDGDHVYAMAGKGTLVCAKTSDGEIVWKAEMKDFGGRVPNWGYSESVLIDGDKVLCTPGGRKGAVLALNKLTGKPIWQSKEFTEPAHYASIIVAEIEGVRQYIQLTPKKLAGLNAEDGSLMWSYDWPGQTAVIPTPIYKDGHVYIASGYGVGCAMVKVTKDSATEVYKNKIMKNHHGGVILVDDHLYGYSDGLGWVCQDFKTGEQVWSEKRKLGKGAVTCAEGMLYCVGERGGEVVLVEASPKGWNEKGRFTLEPQSEFRSPRGKIWTHPVVANGKLYLRDQEIICAYDIKQ